VELRDYIRILRRSWVLITLLALVGVGASAAYSLSRTPQYSSSAQVFVSVQGGDTVADLAQGNSFSQNRVKTYAALATSPIVLAPVIAELGIAVAPADLATRITASAPLDTTLIDIKAASTDPVQAADIANATAQSLANAVDQLERPESAEAVSPVRIAQVRQASIPSAPDSPNVPLNVALGLLIGLALGVGIAVLRETLDNRVRNERDVESITSAPIVGGIAFDKKASERPLIVQVDPRSPRAESFRTMRTNLQYLNVNQTSRTFVFTSSIQGEGKTTTVTNLAIALAEAGSRVLIIDADLRRPRVATYMGLEGAVGLTDMLIGKVNPVDVIQQWGRAELYVLPAGKVPPNPSELLGSRAMRDLITLFEREFDFVLFDAPPLLPVTDAAVLTTHAGSAIVSVAAGYTQKSQLAGAIAALETVGAHVSGVVLTMLPTKGPDAYGHERYGYEYGYTDGDLDETPAKAKAPKRGLSVGRAAKRETVG
jgi:capsular exopolysaccharide synthesis family protein